MKSNYMNSENSEKKTTRSALDIGTTILVAMSTVFFLIALVLLLGHIHEDNSMYAAPTGKMMLNNIMVYNINNVRPFDIVEETADYNAAKSKVKDEYTVLAVSLGEYTEAAFYNYAYGYVGDNEKCAEYQGKMDAARQKMQVHSYADFIDKNYSKYGANKN